MPQENRHLFKTNVSVASCNTADSEILPKTMICAGHKKFGACHADSGASLILDADKVGGVIIGVFSYGLECKEGGRRLGVYTNVAHFTDFIENAMERYK